MIIEVNSHEQLLNCEFTNNDDSLTVLILQL